MNSIIYKKEGQSMEITRPTVLEINLNNFEHNVKQIKEYVGNNVNIMPVIKAGAYGTYINKCIEIINKFDIVAVALVDEAIELRRLGYKNEIFVLNQPYKDEIEKIVTNDININNEISILSDPYIMQNIPWIRYVVWNGAKWKVSSVEVQYPRLILSIGGVYNGEQA